MSARRRQFGSVRQLPSGRWQARFHDPARRKRGAPRTFATSAEAEQFLAAVQTDLARGTWRDARRGQTPFGSWAVSWLETMTTLRPNTLASYHTSLNQHLLPWLSGIPLADIDLMVVQSWLTAMRLGAVGPSARAKAYRLLRRILNAAVDAGFILQNPCRVRGAGSEQAPELRIATVAEVAALADAVPPRFRALVLVAAYSGLRWGELTGLRVRRVDRLHRRLAVAEQLVEVRGELSFGPLKSAAGRRSVTLPRIAADALAEHIPAFSEPGPDGLVFPAQRGGPLRRSNFSRTVWQPATRNAGVDGLRFHDLRHTAATLAILAGASTRELMDRIGHASPAAALRYQHSMEGRDATIADALDALVQAATVPETTRELSRGGEGQVGN